ncbi:30S ribosomal protein S20 [Mycoplasma sp. ATU-Cv-508]|uniref:30S ribosomal protein S20 n=1 Tax=Mycoplasma sp. ATU-Cv-508 TaxID=2048001 RepID=UPI000FDD4D08
MASIKAKIKNIAKIKRQNVRNRAVKSQVKTALKKARQAVLTDPAQSQPLVSKAHKVINKAVSKGVLHPNNGSRKISRLDLFVQQKIQKPPAQSAQTKTSDPAPKN